MPQISQLAATYASQIFWLILVFGILYFVIGRGMVPKIEATVEARDGQIAGDLAAAELARKRADEVEEVYRVRMDAIRTDAAKAQAEAKAAAARASEARVAEADVGIDAATLEAERRLAAAKGSALSEIEAVAAEAAREMVARLSGVQVSEAEASAAVGRVFASG